MMKLSLKYHCTSKQGRKCLKDKETTADRVYVIAGKISSLMVAMSVVLEMRENCHLIGDLGF